MNGIQTALSGISKLSKVGNFFHKTNGTQKTRKSIPISSMKIKFDFDEMKWEGITVNQVKLWERLYPDVDVVNVINFDTVQWLDKKQGTKITQKRNWKSFICNWLKREQERSIGR